MGGSNTPPEPMVSPLSSYQHPNLDPDSSFPGIRFADLDLNQMLKIGAMLIPRFTYGH
jgi:hypothetical protein